MAVRLVKWGMKIREVMKPFLSVGPDTPVAEVANILEREKSNAIPVGEAQNIIGIATADQVLGCTEDQGCNPESMAVEEIVVPVIAMCSEADEVQEVVEHMKANSDECLVVRNAKGTSTGCVTLDALLEELKAVEVGVHEESL